MKKYYDVIFVGGGLANGLAAYRMKQVRPELEFLLVEQADTYGGNHTWSFHDTDLTALEWSWVFPFVSRSWPATEVQFPGTCRTIRSKYHSVTSSRFHDILMSQFSYQIGLKHKPAEISPTEVVLEDGFRVRATCVIDGRGWDPAPHIKVAYQKFVGLDLKLREPHGLDHPVIMDATQPQTDGFRFFYLLPWDERTVMVEDTYYSDDPHLDVDKIRREITDYAKRKGWNVVSIQRQEQATLPIPLEGKLTAGRDGVPAAGSRAGLFHATTGYSFPHAVRFADGLTSLGTLTSKTVFDWSRKWTERHWKSQGFFRFLNRMLFRAARPDERYKILEQFYRRPEHLISRFYAGQLSAVDRARLFLGTPPVPLNKALRCLFEQRSLA